MILNQAQAEAVYSAMCELNNVSAGYVKVVIGAVRVTFKDNRLSVGIGYLEKKRVERYADQAAFSEAYGLN